MDAAARSHAAGLAAGAACLEAALAYLARGWSVLCLCPPDHVGVGKGHAAGCSHPGKRPLGDGGTWKQWQTERADARRLEEWWRQHPNANTGIALGPVSGVVRVDVEGLKGEENLQAASGGDLPPTCEFVSGRGDGTGRGLLYALPDGVEARTSVQGLDAGGELRIQGLGAQTVLPPSRHVSGGRYRWLPGRSPDEIDPAPAPGWLLALLEGSRRSEALTTLADGEVIPYGQCDTRLTSMAGHMRRCGFTKAEIRAALLARIEAGGCETQPGKRPYDESDAERISNSIGAKPEDPYANCTLLLPSSGVNGHAAPAVPEPDATAADLIAARATIRWLWEGWVPLGSLTIAASEPGVGKTRFCADLLRRVSRGLPWPDGTPIVLPEGLNPIGLWVAADNQHPELGTLPTAFGFPPEALYLNAFRSNPFGGTMLDSPEDLKDFEARLQRLRPALVFIDTCLNATDRSAHKPEDAKAFFKPLMEIAQRSQGSMFCLTHLNAGGKPLGRRITGQGRVVMQLERPDPEHQANRRRLYVVKSHSVFPEALGVTMGADGNEYDAAPPTAPDNVAGRGARASRSEQCQTWLLGQLMNGARRVSELRTLAGNEGYSPNTLYDAQRALGAQEFTAEGRKWFRLETPREDSPFND